MGLASNFQSREFWDRMREIIKFQLPFNPSDQGVDEYHRLTSTLDTLDSEVATMSLELIEIDTFLSAHEMAKKNKKDRDELATRLIVDWVNDEEGILPPDAPQWTKDFYNRMSAVGTKDERMRIALAAVDESKMLISGTDKYDRVEWIRRDKMVERAFSRLSHARENLNRQTRLVEAEINTYGKEVLRRD